MKAHQIVDEHKKGVRAKKYNKKPKAYITPKKPVAGPVQGGSYGADAGYSGVSEDTDNKPQLMTAFTKFLPLAMHALALKKLPKIKLEKIIIDHEQPTFGKYDDGEQIIYLAIENRHALDILRTLAHELVHFKQNTEHRLDVDSGGTGSEIENEANAQAAIIMRHFNKKYPEFFKDSAVDLESNASEYRKTNELFDGGKDWKWTYQDKNQAMAEFTVGDVHYTFSAGQDPDEAPGDWDIEFAAKKEAGTASWGVTGTGNSAQVFGTVVEIMKAFITSKKASIRRMTFAAKEDSRQGLYARMVKRLLPKWNLEQNGEAFVLTRPGGLVFWVYSVEAPYNKIPPVKVKANSAKEAEQIVLTTMPEFKGADLMGMGASKNKPDLSENFADGRNPQDKGDSKRHGVPTKASISTLRKVAKQGGRKGQLAHWMANMKSGREK